MHKSVFLTFIFGLFPGAGQMYQEYMKRGLSLMTLTAVCFFFSMILQSPLFSIPIPILWVYSFFDTFRLRNHYIRENEKLEDAYIWENTNIDTSFMKGFFHKKNYILGIILIVGGIYFFLDSFLLNLLYTFEVPSIVIESIYFLIRYIPTLLVSIVAILFGIKLVTNKGGN